MDVVSRVFPRPERKPKRPSLHPILLPLVAPTSFDSNVRVHGAPVDRLYRHVGAEQGDAICVLPPAGSP